MRSMRVMASSRVAEALPGPRSGIARRSLRFCTWFSGYWTVSM